MNPNIGVAVLVVTATSLLTVAAILLQAQLSTGGRLSKEFDPEYGVVCYWHDIPNQRQLSCLQVAPTAADLDLEDAPAQEEIEATKYVF